MTSSTSFLNKTPLLLAALLCLFGCAGPQGTLVKGPPVGARGMRVAVLPVFNMSGAAAPLKDIRQLAEAALTGRGLTVTDDDALEKFMAKHRIRYTGGLSRDDSRTFKEELGVGSVLITSIELYSPSYPPKIALNMRLVRTGDNPEILWTDSVGMAGDDSPGFLLLGLIGDPKVLTGRALGRLTGSLTSYLEGGGMRPGCPAGRKFSPRVFYRSPGFDPGKRYKVAVLPFLNNSDRGNAGEILALEFVRQLVQSGKFTVMEPGLVREELLKYRIIMEGGVSIDTAGVVLETLDADLVLSGNVLDYEDYQGLFGTAKIGFSVLLIDRKDKEVVWESRSFDEGDEYVFFFDRGKINTTGGLACRMVGNVVQMMVER